MNDIFPGLLGGYMKKHISLSIYSLAVALSVSPVFATSVYAQEDQQPAPATDDSGLGDIVVTAQRREQSIQSTPIAVTSLSGDTLVTRGLQSVNDLAGVVPGFAVRDAGQSMQYNLRGYISTDGRANADGPVAVYIDDVFLGAAVMQQMESLDVSRVEALRGPQGTLFGRNAVGGLVHYISNTPGDEFGGYARLQLGQFDERIAEGALNIPLGDDAALRVAMKYNRNSGWQENLLGGKNRSSKNALSGRAQLKFQVTDTLKATFSFQADHQRNQYQGYTSLGALNQAGTAVCSYSDIVAGNCFLGGAAFSNVPAGTKSLATYNPKRIYSTLASDPDNYDAQLAIARFDWEAGDHLTLSSITSWAHGKRSFIEDDNATGLAANAPFNFLQHAFDGEQVSQELRASGRLFGDTQYVLGAYYLKSTKHDLYAFLDPNAQNIIFYATPYETLKTETLAAFGQAEVPLTDQLRAIVGGRYTWEKKKSQRQTENGAFLPDSSASLDRFTGKVGLEWTPGNGLMFYGHASTGFKSGEFPSNGDNAPLDIVAPETITAYEIGMKSDFFDRKVRLNLAAFANEIKNKQSVTTIIDGSGTQRPYFVSFGRVVQKGFEAELTVRPIDAVTLGGSIAYTDNKIRPVAGVTVQRLANFQTFSLDGNQLPGAPKFQANLNADVTLPVGLPGDLVFGVSWRFQGKTYMNLSNNEVEVQPAYNVGDLRLTYTAPDDRWNVGAFVSNVTNTYYSNVNFSFGGSDVLTIQWARPRWAGVRAGINF